MIEYSFDPDATVCQTKVEDFWPKFYFIFMITVFFFIPLVILVLLYRHIARHLVPPDDEQVTNNHLPLIKLDPNRDNLGQKELICNLDDNCVKLSLFV